MSESGFQNRRVRQATGSNSDRRVQSRMSPPPYLTASGEISVDRRSCFDRRATWIREFSMTSDDGLAS